MELPLRGVPAFKAGPLSRVNAGYFSSNARLDCSASAICWRMPLTRVFASVNWTDNSCCLFHSSSTRAEMLLYSLMGNEAAAGSALVGSVPAGASVIALSVA